MVGTGIDPVEVEKISSCVELECGTTPAGRRRSSSSLREVPDGPLSSQFVYEQTSGVLRHTESVRDDKVQKRDWRQMPEQKSRAPPARPSDDITTQSHSVPGGQSVSDIQVRTLRTVADARSNDPVRSQASSENESVSVTAAQGQWRRTTRPQVSEALFLLYLIPDSPQVARPPAHATAPRPAQSPQVSREVCVCSRCRRRSLVGLVGRGRQ